MRYLVRFIITLSHVCVSLSLFLNLEDRGGEPCELHACNIGMGKMCDYFMEDGLVI